MWKELSTGKKTAVIAGSVLLVSAVIYIATKGSSTDNTDTAGNFDIRTPAQKYFDTTTQDAYVPVDVPQAGQTTQSGLGLTEDQAFNNSLKNQSGLGNMNDAQSQNWFKRTFGFTGIQNA